MERISPQVIARAVAVPLAAVAFGVEASVAVASPEQQQLQACEDAVTNPTYAQSWNFPNRTNVNYNVSADAVPAGCEKIVSRLVTVTELSSPSMAPLTAEIIANNMPDAFNVSQTTATNREVACGESVVQRVTFTASPKPEAFAVPPADLNTNPVSKAYLSTVGQITCAPVVTPNTPPTTPNTPTPSPTPTPAPVASFKLVAGEKLAPKKGEAKVLTSDKETRDCELEAEQSIAKTSWKLLGGKAIRQTVVATSIEDCADLVTREVQTKTTYTGKGSSRAFKPLTKPFVLDSRPIAFSDWVKQPTKHTLRAGEGVQQVVSVTVTPKDGSASVQKTLKTSVGRIRRSS